MYRIGKRTSLIVLTGLGSAKSHTSTNEDFSCTSFDSFVTSCFRELAFSIATVMFCKASSASACAFLSFSSFAPAWRQQHLSLFKLNIVRTIEFVCSN